MIERWKHTAFGSDFGMDVLSLLESLVESQLDLGVVCAHCDLGKYLDAPQLLKERTDNEVAFLDSPFHRYVHFEDMVIALAAVMAHAWKNQDGVDLSRAGGEKVIRFVSTPRDRERILGALEGILANPDGYVLFEMCQGSDRDETLADIREIRELLRESLA